MVFQSLIFIQFFLAVLTAYWLLRRREWQNGFLLAASLVFYGWVHAWWVILILLTCVVDFTAARLLTDRPHQRKRWLVLSLVTNFSILAVYKYFDFFSGSVAALGQRLGWEIHPFLLHVGLPAGISFYTFQSASYVVDVYRKKMEVRRSLPEYVLFVSFFPHLVAGPIQRAHFLLSQIERPRVFDARVARGAVLLILWGFFKKLVIADNAAMVVAKVFSLDDPTFPVLWSGVFAFGVQIYADFSAYTDIARGISRLLGFELCQNFDHPYSADSPQDFWRRWHISLSNWFRDYVYIPLGGSRCSLAMQCRNLLLTFLLSGLWHGAAWNFVLWGAWHGVLLVLWTLWGKAPAAVRPERLPRFARVILTFILVHIGWLLFREQSAPHLLKHFSLNPFAADSVQWRIGWFFVVQTLFYAFPLYLHPLVDRFLARHPEAVAEHFPGWRWTLVLMLTAALLYAGLLLLRSPASSDFIYFQF
ncbi:MAG: MBOAT family O-acyltransferase [Verrucomicrobiota bacterium]